MKRKMRKCVSTLGIILESSSMTVHLLFLFCFLAQYSRKEELGVKQTEKLSEILSSEMMNFSSSSTCNASSISFSVELKYTEFLLLVLERALAMKSSPGFEF